MPTSGPATEPWQQFWNGLFILFLVTSVKTQSFNETAAVWCFLRHRFEHLPLRTKLSLPDQTQKRFNHLPGRVSLVGQGIERVRGVGCFVLLVTYASKIVKLVKKRKKVFVWGLQFEQKQAKKRPKATSSGELSENVWPLSLKLL